MRVSHPPFLGFMFIISIFCQVRPSNGCSLLFVLALICFSRVAHHPPALTPTTPHHHLQVQALPRCLIRPLRPVISASRTNHPFCLRSKMPSLILPWMWSIVLIALSFALLKLIYF